MVKLMNLKLGGGGLGILHLTYVIARLLFEEGRVTLL